MTGTIREDAATVARHAPPGYGERLERVREGMDALPHGAQQSAAFDLRIAPSVVSNVINGRTVRDDVLGRLEEWLDEATPLSVASSRDSVADRAVTADEFAAERLAHDDRAMTPVDEVVDAYVAWLGDRPGLSRWPLVNHLRKTWPTTKAASGQVFAGVRFR